MQEFQPAVIIWRGRHNIVDDHSMRPWFCGVGGSEEEEGEKN